MTFEFDLKPAPANSDIHNPEIRARLEHANLPYEQRFVAYVSDGLEAALFTCEELRHADIFFIQNIFVLPEFRRHGIGSFILAMAEDMARQGGMHYVWLRPRPIDSVTTVAWLREWYSHHGYTWSEGRDLMQKVVGG